MNLYILLVALVLYNSRAFALHINRALNTSTAKENESSFNRTLVEPQNNAESSDQDGEVSKQIIGSSVVTSVSVILNGKEPEYADASGKKVPKPQAQLQVASPINLLNPDRYEFYTFDDHGELVKRLMTMQEIQSIVANGDGEGPTIIHPAPINQRDPEKNVQDIVNSVQSVLNREVESTKNVSNNDSVPPPLDTPDVSSSWSMILPAIFGNTGGEIFSPNKQQQHQTPDSPDIVEYSTKPNTKPSSKPHKKRKPGNKRKTTTRTTTTAKPNEEDSYQVIQEELGPNESVYTGLQKYQNIAAAAANAQNFESLSSNFYNLHKHPENAKLPQNATIENEPTISATVAPELNATEMSTKRTTTATTATTLKYKQKIKYDNQTSSTEASKPTLTARPLNKKKKPTRQPGGQKRKPSIQHPNNQKNRFTTPVPLIDAIVDQKVNINNTAIPSAIDLSIHKMEPSTHKPLIFDPITTNKIADVHQNVNLKNQNSSVTTEKPEITNFTINNLILQSPTTEGVILINQLIDNETKLPDIHVTSEKSPQQQQHTNRYPIPQLINEYSPPVNINESVQQQDQLQALQNTKDDDLNTKLSFDQIMESLKENVNSNEQQSSASPQTTIPMLYGGVESFDKLELLSASKKVIAGTTTAAIDHQSTTVSAQKTVPTTERSKPITAADLAQYEDLIQAFESTTPKFSYVEQTESNSIKFNDSEQLVLITQRPQILHSSPSPHTTTNLPVTVTNTEAAESNYDSSDEMTTIAPIAGDELLTINDHQVLKFEPLYADVQDPIVTDITTTLSPLMTTYNPELDITEQELQLSESVEDGEQEEVEEAEVDVEKEADSTTLISTTTPSDTEENTSFPHKIESLVVDEKDSIEIEKEIRENQKTVNSSVDVRMDDIRTQAATIVPAATGETNVKIIMESTTDLNIAKDEIETLMSQVYSQMSDDFRPSNATVDDIVMDGHQNQETSNRLSSFAQINPSFQINSSTSLASSVLHEVANEEQTLPLLDDVTTTQAVVEFEDTTLNYNTSPLSNNDYIEVTSAPDSESTDDSPNENVDTDTELEMEMERIMTTNMPAIGGHDDAIETTTLKTTEHSDIVDMFSMTSIEPDIELTTKLDSNTEHTTLVDNEEEEDEELTTLANANEKDEKKELFEITTARIGNNVTFNSLEQSTARIPVLTTPGVQATEGIDTLSTNKQDSLKHHHQFDEDPYIKLGEIGGKARVPVVPQKEINSELKDKEESGVSFITTKTSAQPTSPAVTEKSLVTPQIASSTTSSTTLSTKKTPNTLKPVSYYKQPSFDSHAKYPFVQNFNWQQQPQQQRPIVRPASLNNLKVASASPSRPPVKLDASPSNSTGLEASIDEMDEDLQDFSRLCNELAFTYWKSITSEKISSARSLIISPFALTSMLAMIFLGARGGTSGEMNEVLKLDDMVTFNPHLVFKNITESVEKAMDSNIATAAFVREIFSDRSNGKILQFFKEKTQQFYAAHVEEVNFHMANDIIRRRTNLLVKRHTSNKVHEYWRTNSEWVNGPLASISANLFQTDCTFASTHERDGEMFFQVHPSVRQRRLVPIPAVLYKTGFMVGYEPAIDASIVAFGKIHDTVSTIFVMPGHQNTIAPADSLQRLEKDLLDTAFSKHSWTNILTSLMQRPDIEVQLPRFSHRSFVNASLGLQKMGLKGLFKSDFADLRGLTGSSSRDIFLSDMIQINTFSTCGEEKISGNHHVEIYPAPPIRKRNKDVDVMDEFENDSFDGIIDGGPFSHESVGREFFDDHLLDPKFLELPLPLRPRQARIPDAPRLRFDKPFLFFVRHNPTGVILFMGRFNPRLQP